MRYKTEFDLANGSYAGEVVLHHFKHEATSYFTTFSHTKCTSFIRKNPEGEKYV